MHEAVGVIFSSKSLFRVMLWLHDRSDELFYQDQYRQETGNLNTKLRNHLERLETVGMIVRSDQGPGDNRKWWRKLDSPYWKVVEAFCQAATSEDIGLVE